MTVEVVDRQSQQDDLRFADASCSLRFGGCVLRPADKRKISSSQGKNIVSHPGLDASMRVSVKRDSESAGGVRRTCIV